MEAKYQVLENGTDRLMGTYSTKARASSAVDRFDNAYGAYHYHVKEVKAPAQAVDSNKAARIQELKNARAVFCTLSGYDTEIKRIGIELQILEVAQ